MDGTLTANVIDFAAMRRKAGVHPVHGDILDEVAKMSPERQARARAGILEVEEQARHWPEQMAVQSTWLKTNLMLTASQSCDVRLA